jgi:superfamily I DNA and RNA helicase
MALEIQLSRPIRSDAAASDLVETLKHGSTLLRLDDAVLYYGYPRYRDEDDELIAAHLLLMSPQHGIVIFGTIDSTGRSPEDQRSVRKATESVLAMVYSKLLANKALRKTPVKLRVPVVAYLYAPHITNDAHETGDLECLTSHDSVRRELSKCSPLEDDLFAQLTATIDGTRSIPRPKKRDLEHLTALSKGRLVEQLESALATFDVKQREGSIAAVTGPQRIRGLAGSGKTIVLTRKAALTHIDNHNASIAYTFHTKSLYQQIRRLITRFYRSEHDRDPDWNRVSVLHSWGGGDPGIYSLACRQHGVRPIPFGEAKAGDPSSPFGYACRKLLETGLVGPMYDYVFIDEGQDYPPEFVQLCAQLAHHMQFVYAYDDLRSMFQAHAPDAAAIFGVSSEGLPNTEVERDIVLYKCYRNPREILVCAHAIGFGLYGKPVQMLENREHWEDVGYEVAKGPLEAGQEVSILRPERNSISLLSEAQTIDQLIETAVYGSLEDEVSGVTKAILAQIRDGLRPDDIVVAVVDDRNAREYLNLLAAELSRRNIACNNIHEASGVPDFQLEGRVTLTTVHKAKGNEGFAVHVIGADAVFQYPTKGNRNRLFTAMTRAKAWLRVTGVGPAADRLAKEIEAAKANSPYLRFKYPSEAEIEMMKRDLGREAALSMEQERVLEEIPEDQLTEYLQKRRKAGKKK